jgi:hypothetical protein
MELEKYCSNVMPGKGARGCVFGRWKRQAFRPPRKTNMFIIRLMLMGMLFASLAASGFPAEKPGPFPGATEAPRPAETDDPLGRSTPKGAVLGFIKSATQGDYESPSARVRFIGFGDSSLNLEVFAYVLETVYETFLHIQEDLLLRIMDIVSGSGSGFAFPSQTTYLAQDAGMDAVKSQKALATVRQWREQGELPFPDFSPETIAKLNNRLEYPPPDSAKGRKLNHKGRSEKRGIVE